MDNKLRIAFFGEDSFSTVILNSLIKAGHEICLVVTPYYDNVVYKRLELICNRNGIRFYRTKKINSDQTTSVLKEANPQLCVISHFERLIKKQLLDISPMGFINLHPSLLPEYRGMAPQHWPIINGESKTGVTVHYVDEGTDTGDIILQEEIELLPTDYVYDLQKKWLKIYEYIMVEAIDKILSGAPTIKQSHLKGLYYGKLKIEDCQIDLSRTTIEVMRLIQGVSRPYYGARLNNHIIWNAHIASPSEIVLEFINKYEQGGVLLTSDGAIVIDTVSEG